jgi:hypothetical protein
MPQEAWNNHAAEMEPPMNAKERLDIVMKEYDALRREIDNRTDSFRTHGVPAVTVAVAAVVGVRSNIPPDALLALLPSVGLLILTISVTAWLYLDRVGRRLAVVEDRVYQISGEPLLTHETELILDRQIQPITWPKGAFVLSAIYVAVEAALLLSMGSATKIYFAQHLSNLMLLLTLIAVPPAKLIADTLRMYGLRRQGLDGSKLYELLRRERESRLSSKAEPGFQNQSHISVLAASTPIPQSVSVTAENRSITQSTECVEDTASDQIEYKRPE